MRKSEIHMHSTFSDGEYTPTELVRIAIQNKVSILSLTDHDTFAGIEELVQAAEGTGISAFPGIEMTTQYQDFNIHLLAYFKSLDSIDRELAETVSHMSEKRVRRMRELIDRINDVVPEKFKGKILFENVRKAAEGVLARPHLAREMVQLGIVSSTGQAFEQYLVEYNVERENITVQKAMALIRKCGGIPVLAHPGERTYSLYHPDKGRDYAEIPAQLEELISFGLLGLECLYPYHEKINKVEFYTNLANKMGLIVTGSRDFHGFTSYQKPALLGTTPLNDEFFDRFQEAWG
ncbi:COG0613, Predicted metal-dependent phosphoesterases (PHP family) [hydrothermal vent metagenome]|uniref:COG0613, Predicted metal-dependent phosphoesterases (PHP family) n=1 Tax=hydrothermal vent metagenome TaxID=652676 RepID=A0A3B1CCA5_9ZZZZ